MDERIYLGQLAIETDEIVVSDPTYADEVWLSQWHEIHDGDEATILACNPFAPISSGLFFGLRLLGKPGGLFPAGAPAPFVFLETDAPGKRVRFVIEIELSD